MRPNQFRIDPRLLDGLVAAILTIGLQIHMAVGDHAGSPVVNIICGLLLTVPLIARRRAPVAVAAILVGAAIINSALGGSLYEGQPPPPAALLAGIVTFYSLGAYADDRASVITMVLAIAGLWTDVLVGGDIDLPSFVFSGGLVVAIPWLVGRNARSRRLRLELLERDQLQREQVAVGEERSRIAREIHDVVAHSVVGMVAQAQGARRMLDHDPERAREALLLIEQTGQDSLKEMRSSLGVLRRPEGEAPLTPQPGVEDIEHLVEQSRQSGMEIDLTIEGEPRRPLPPGVGLSAYRIVQEALTNVLKHAGPVTAWVIVRFDDEELRIEIGDEGRLLPAAGAGFGGGVGHGLVGIEERVSLYGGVFEAGPRSDGGFLVRATIPLVS